MFRCGVMTGLANLRKACVYKGYGMYEKDSALLLRELTQRLKGAPYTVAYITPEEIREGKLLTETKLLVIGGGFDLGLIKVLGQHGMSQIRDFVSAGGSYLGICSGAYFACDYIEFDKRGPLRVVGERFLKFYPGVCTGPLYKPYVYDSTEGAVASCINLTFDGEKGSSVKHQQQLDHLQNGVTSDGNRGSNVKLDEKCNPELSNHLKNGVIHSVKCNKTNGCDNDQMKPVQNGMLKGDEVKHQTKVDAGSNLLLGNDAKRNKSSASDVNSKQSKCSKIYAHGEMNGVDGCEFQNGVERTQEEICTSVKKIPYCNIDSEVNMTNKEMQAKIYFNGGGQFIPQSMKSYLKSQDSQNTLTNLESQNSPPSIDSNNSYCNKPKRLKTESSNLDQNSTADSCHIPSPGNSGIEADVFKNVTVLSRYLDLPNQPVAMVKCKVGKGVAVLSGGHFDHAPEDIKDDNDEIHQVISELKKFKTERDTIFKVVLEHLNMPRPTDNKT